MSEVVRNRLRHRVVRQFYHSALRVRANILWRTRGLAAEKPASFKRSSPADTGPGSFQTAGQSRECFGEDFFVQRRVAGISYRSDSDACGQSQWQSRLCQSQDYNGGSMKFECPPSFGP